MSRKGPDLKRLVAGLGGECLWSEPLSRHTTLKIGGPADLLYLPAEIDDLQQLMTRAHAARVPVFVLGGSNLLVQDGGIRGIVVTLRRMTRVRALDEVRIEADAGVPLTRLARYAAERSLTGFEFALGIPGTVGGGVVMNAGTPRGDVGGCVESVRIVTPAGRLRDASRPEIEFGYRWSRLPGGIITAATLRLERGDRETIRRRMQEDSHRRRETQPLTLPNAGSVFKNPEGSPAARLIEAAGLKGLRIGDAQISDRHANFIVNCGQASARDVVALIRTIGRTVEQRNGVRLELELRIVGAVH